MNLIEPWAFVIIALAAWRVFHLIAKDKILNRPRRWLLRGPLETWEKEGDDPGDDYRLEWGLFLTCAYCAGFWISGIALSLYCVIVEWVGVFSFLCLWFAISAAVALIAVNLEEDDK